MEVLVEYDYLAQNSDELTIKKGDRIRNVTKKEEGWFEGELVTNGRRGLFPDNFVKPIKTGMKQAGFINNKSPDDKKKNLLIMNNGKLPNGLEQPVQLPVPTSSPPPPPANSNPPPPPKNAHHPDLFNAKVLYSYIPVNDDELAIQENEIVRVIRLVEDGWYEGIYNGRQGVFPSNYVERVNEPANKSLSNESINNNSFNEHSENDKGKKKIVGIGFGNIFDGEKIKLKTKENFSKSQVPPIQQPLPPKQEIITQPQVVQHPVQHPVQPSPINVPIKHKIKARVLYDYVPNERDELKLSIGEYIFILDKNLEDEGWWRGESIATGEIGVFPDNFVEEIIELSPVNNNNIPNQNSARRNSTLKNNSSSTINDSNTSSASSSNNSLSRTFDNVKHQHIQPPQPQQQQQQQQQQPPAQQPPQHFQTLPHQHVQSPLQPQNFQTLPHQSLSSIKSDKHNLNGSFEDGRISNQYVLSSDIGENLDDVQEKNKLTHIKKTRQFNKRPPSFRGKQNRNDHDGESMHNGDESVDEHEFSSSKSQLSSSPPVAQSGHHAVKSPVQDSELNSSSQLLNGKSSVSSALSDEVTYLKQELDMIRKSSTQLRNDYKLVQTEIVDLKKTHDDQMKKCKKDYMIL